MVAAQVFIEKYRLFFIHYNPEVYGPYIRKFALNRFLIKGLNLYHFFFARLIDDIPLGRQLYKSSGFQGFEPIDKFLYSFYDHDKLGDSMKNAGIDPFCDLIRGGTDGSRLSFMGMPCPNLSTGEMAIHSKHEYVVVQDMQKSVKTLIELIQIWERNHES